MRILKPLFLVPVLVTASYAQQTQTNKPLGERLTPASELQITSAEVAEPELEPLAIDERPNKQRIAAIVAVREGNRLWRSGKTELAAACYRDAITLQPELYAAHLNLGIARLQGRRLSDAVTAFQKAVELRAESASGWQGLGLAFYYHGQYQSALVALERAQRLAPEDVRFNNNLGFLYLLTHRLDHAITFFKKTLELNQNYPTAKIGLCGAYTLAEQPTAALDLCLEAARNYATSAVPKYFLGHAYLDLGDMPKSISAFEEAARIEPTTAKVFIGLGTAYFKANKYERALSSFQQARQLDGKVNEALSGIGAAYAQLRKYDKAEAVLREVLLRDPGHHVSRYNLGVVCLLRKNRECALTQYNYLKMNGDVLAKRLFTSIHGDKVVDVTAYQNQHRR